MYSCKSLSSGIIKLMVAMAAFLSVGCSGDKNISPRSKSNERHLSIADSLYQISKGFSKLKNYDSAIYYAHLANNHLKLADSLEGQAKILSNIGLYHYFLGEYDSSEHYYNRALKTDSLKNFETTISTYKNFGVLFKKRAQYQQAFEAYQSAHAIAVKHNNHDDLAAVNNNIGNLLCKQDKRREAIKYHQLALNTWFGLDDTTKTAQALNGLGNDYLGLKQYDSAIYYYHKSLQLKRSGGKGDEIVRTLNNLGEIYLVLKDYDSAGFYLRDAFNIKKRLKKYEQSVGLTANNMARLYLAEGNMPLSRHYLDTAWLLVKKGNIRDLMVENYGIRSRWHETQGQADSALHYYRAGHVLGDSLFKQEKLRVLEDFAAFEKREMGRQKEAAESRLRQEQKLADTRLKGMGVIALFSGLLLVLLINAFVQGDKIKKLNTELGVLNSDILHRKKNHQSLIIHALDRFGSDSHLDAIKNMIFASTVVDEKLYKNVGPSKKVTLDHYFGKLLRDLTESLGLDTRSVRIIPNISAIRIGEDRAVKIAFIISELITNSVKHAHFDTELVLKIDISKARGLVNITYSDNGAKIDTSALKSSGGMGWGLITDFAKSLGTKVKIGFIDGWNVSSLSFKI